MQTRDALRLAVEDLFEQLSADGHVYAEIRFAPLLHLAQGLTAEEVVEATHFATEDAVRQTGIEARLILCTLRHYSTEESMRTALLVRQFAGTRVAGFDIAGDEAGYRLDAHIAAFRYARENGLKFTAHAGEACGPASVLETLEGTGTKRIGHGVRSVEDQLLVDRLVSDGVHLEVCPTCNVQTDICETYADHPIDRLFRAGVSVGINSDTRTITDVMLSQEYEKLHETFGWGPKHFLKCNVDALGASLADFDAKSRLLDVLEKGYTASVMP